MTFGEKLQLLRRQRGLSQEKLAEQLGVSRQSVSKWELGDSLPDTGNIKQLRGLFGVSTDYLLIDEIEAPDIISPAPKETEEEKSPRRPAAFIFGAVCSGIGGLGCLAILILSTMVQVHVTKKRLLPDGSVEYYGGGSVVGYSLIGFIQQYRLQALLIFLAVLIVAGAVSMVVGRRARLSN